MLTNQEVFKMLEKQTVSEVTHALINKYGEKIGTEALLRTRLNRLKKRKPQKSIDTPEYIKWANTVFHKAGEQKPNFKKKTVIKKKGPNKKR